MNNHSPIPEFKASQTLDENWNPIKPLPIAGLELREVKNVIYRNGVLTELFRPEWFDDRFKVGHVVFVSLLPGLTTQWHRHHEQEDIVIPVRGTIRMGFYDSREDSPTRGKGCVLNFNLMRPRYIYIPPGVWHALRLCGVDTRAAHRLERGAVERR